MVVEKMAKKLKELTLENSNLDWNLEGDTLTMKVKVTKELRLSKSGKTMLISTTSGNRTLEIPELDDEDIFIGINIFKYPKRE